MVISNYTDFCYFAVLYMMCLLFVMIVFSLLFFFYRMSLSFFWWFLVVGLVLLCGYVVVYWFHLFCSV